MATLNLEKLTQSQRNQLAKDAEKELLAKLASGTPEGQEILRRHLLQQALCYHYSFGNNLLAILQGARVENGETPEFHAVSLLNSMERWGKLGRRLRRGAKAIWVRGPQYFKVKDKKVVDGVEVEEERTVQWFPVCRPIYDISQTYGKPLETLSIDCGQDGIKVFAALVGFAEKKGVPLAVKSYLHDKGAAEGWAIRQEANVQEFIPEEKRLPVGIHEVAHVMLGHTDILNDIPGALAEGEAEAVSFIVLKHFGVSDPVAPEYIRNHGCTPAMLKDSLHRIGTAAKEIVEGLSVELGLKKPYKKREQKAA